MPAPTADTPEATTTSTTDEVLARRTGPPRPRPRRAAPDARAHRPARRRQGDRRLDEELLGPGAGPPRRLPAGRPAHHPVLRPDRHRTPSDGRGDASTSGAGTSPTTAATRWWSTGGAASRPPFYRATPHRADGRRLRRRFGFDRGQLTAYEDEHLAGGDEREPAAAGSSPPRSSGPASGPMRDIVATIQPEQDELVRADVGDDASACRARPAPARPRSACTAPRTCSTPTASGCDRSGVLVVGPNRAFLTTSARCCPRSARCEVRHDDGRRPARRTAGSGPPTPPDVAHRSRATRGWPRCCAGPSGRTSAEPTEAARRAARLTPLAGARARAARTIVAELRARGVRYGAARRCSPSGWPTRAHCRWSGRGESPDDRVQDAVARAPPVRNAVDSALAGRRPGRSVLLRLLSEPRRSLAAADGILDSRASRRLLLLGQAGHAAKGAARWTAADAVLLDEAADLLDRTPSLGHVVLDEAQDLSPMQLRAVGRRCSTGSLDRARRHRPGHDAVGDRRLGRVAGAPRQARRPRSRCSTAASGCRPRSSSSPPGCCRTSRPGSPRRRRCATTPAGSTWSDHRRRTCSTRSPRRCAARLAAPGSVGVIAADAASTGCRRLADAGLAHGRSAGPGDDEEPRSTLVPATLAKGWSSTRSSSSSRRASSRPSRERTACAGSTSC